MKNNASPFDRCMGEHELSSLRHNAIKRADMASRKTGGVGDSSTKSLASQPLSSMGGGHEDLRLFWMAQYIGSCFTDIPEGSI